MPDRIIRDEILNSDTVLGLKRNTHRLAFVACVLEADDLGNFEAGPGALWRLWRDWLALTDRSQVPEIVLALTDADLIRLYEVDGKRYAHIPKFRQRLRYPNGKHPRPPQSLECKQINELMAKKTDRSPTIDGPQSDRSPPKRREVKRSEVKRREENARESPVDNSVAVVAATHALASKLKGENPKTGNGGKWWTSEAGIAAKGAEIGLPAGHGEKYEGWKARIFDEIKRRQQA